MSLILTRVCDVCNREVEVCEYPTWIGPMGYTQVTYVVDFECSDCLLIRLRIEAGPNEYGVNE